MKGFFETCIALLILFVFFVVPMALGLWFLQGGDLRDIPKGCYSSEGCKEVEK